MVAIPNHHFFQWVNQLKDEGHEIIWFDITDGGKEVGKLKWLKQIKGWKLRWDYPFRHKIKKWFPKFYSWIQNFNEHQVSKVFSKVLTNLEPDLVHCFEMQLAGFPILKVMEQNNLPFVYSSWGSDLFYYEKMGVSKEHVQRFLKRVDYLITDCKRDFSIAMEDGFKGAFLGIYPGNGGIQVLATKIKKTAERNTILVKGYDDGVGKAIMVLKALELLSEDIIKDFKIVLYSADIIVKDYIEASLFFKKQNVAIYLRSNFLPNESLLELMGESCIHIANSISDGMPNALIEAMGMGAFPIQSNPGGVTVEIIENGKNGFLISEPFDVEKIAEIIEQSIINRSLREKAQAYNVKIIKDNYNRDNLKVKILDLYKTIKNE